jgi:hypothetical protein
VPSSGAPSVLEPRAATPTTVSDSTLPVASWSSGRRQSFSRMYPLWDLVIAPILEAAEARRVLEIGALQGETTVKMLESLGPDSEVHVIDPVPQFDPAEHERRFPGRYHFHREISLEVLPGLPPMDAALIDGDHNWYTVYNELKMLATTAREAGAQLPILILHDVGWPYGRRDLYYAPERIPEKFRQPYARKGIRLRSKAGRPRDLLKRGGFNPRLNNAAQEGGARNGVMTAVEDFVAEYERPLRLQVVPLYFGLAVVTDEERVAASEQLADALDSLDHAESLRELLELSEQMRIDQMHWGQVAIYRWQDRLDAVAERYLNLLRADLDVPADALGWLVECLNTIRAERVQGDFVQCGLGGRDAAILMHGFTEVHRMKNSKLWFAVAGSATHEVLDGVRTAFERFDLLDDRVEFLGDWSALDQAPIEKAALLRIGSDAPVGETLTKLYGKLAMGGFVLVEDASRPERRGAVEQFRIERGVEEPLEPAEPAALTGWRKVR